MLSDETRASRSGPQRGPENDSSSDESSDDNDDSSSDDSDDSSSEQRAERSQPTDSTQRHSDSEIRFAESLLCPLLFVCFLTNATLEMAGKNSFGDPSVSSGRTAADMADDAGAEWKRGRGWVRWLSESQSVNGDSGSERQRVCLTARIWMAARATISIAVSITLKVVRAGWLSGAATVLQSSGGGWHRTCS